eukprot:NODE_5_length_5289_cov_242.816492_g4_i0.p1 GENE.NODE_5_length_5289_cov_242.816492_g4_i0~~NODE_5_length_5289_cov_242.816492_g4_i0.p1  ORF type:complete len:1679 (-),score=414.19 NODE_5_length_5289_cov_242.816492_g4_i0:253-5238(-)
MSSRFLLCALLVFTLLVAPVNGWGWFRRISVVNVCVGWWHGWSACSGSCGTGQSYRRWSGVGWGCPGTQSRSCSSPCPCSGYWQGWGGCNRACGTGTQSRSYRITRYASHGGAGCPYSNGRVDTKTCNTHPCPISCTGVWSEWSACSTSCGATGTRKAKYTITRNPAYGGAACPYANGAIKTASCSVPACPATPLAVSIPDSRAGCPGSYPAGQPLITSTFEMKEAGSVYVTAEIIRHAAGRDDVTLVLDGTVVARDLPYSAVKTWQQGYLTYSGNVGAGRHTFWVAGSKDSVYGCGSSWGRINVMPFDGQPNRAISVYDTSPCRRAGSTPIRTNVHMTAAGSFLVSAQIIRYNPEKDRYAGSRYLNGKDRYLTLYVNGKAVDMARSRVESYQWDTTIVDFAGELPAGNNDVKIVASGGYSEWGCGTGWGHMNIVKFPGRTGQAIVQKGSGATAGSLIKKTIYLPKKVGVMVSGHVRRDASGRNDMKLRIDGHDKAWDLPYSQAYSNQPAHVFFATELPAGHHTFEVVSNSGSNWKSAEGHMSILLNQEPCFDWGCTCQGMSNHFGTSHGITWGSATAIAKKWWGSVRCNTYPAVDCVGTWSGYSACTKSCGGGRMTRTYRHTVAARHGGRACPHANGYVYSAPCASTPCPVDCVGAYAAWGPCSRSCGSGRQGRYYKVSRNPAHGGRACPVAHNRYVTRTCNTNPCPVDCVGAWTGWSSCDKSCGTGRSTRTYLYSRAPMHGGKSCPSTHGAKEHRTCNTLACPIDCVGDFSDFNTCSKECGGGVQHRTYHHKVVRANGGKACPREAGSTYSAACNTHACPVNCEGHWSSWSSCDKQCGGGLSKRTYTVTVAAQHGGKACSAAHRQVQTRSCNSDPCPVNCIATITASACSKSCGGGQITYSRKVVRDAAHGGKACPAIPAARACNTQACPVHCVGAWSEMTSCTKTCGGGEMRRTYTHSVQVAHGGTPCPTAHNEVDIQPCNTQSCPVHCEGAWGEFSACSKSCGGGSKTRTFQISTAAAHGGKGCDAEHAEKENQPCNTEACPVDCVGAWGEFDECTKTCGGGSQTRKYTHSVTVAHGGKVCPKPHNAEETRACSTAPCPIDCEGSWGEFGACNKECGAGTKKRTFSVKVAAAHGGQECDKKHNEEDEIACNTEPCPVNCVGEWGAYSECSASCGTGSQVRKFVHEVKAAFGGKACDLEHGAESTQACNSAPCPVDCEGAWGEYTACSKSCGTGSRSRSYKVFTEAAHGGKECAKENNFLETSPCNSEDCPAPCVGDWSEWSECDKTCGSGSQTRTYKISNKGETGGEECPFADEATQTQMCGTTVCPQPRHCVGMWGEWTACSKTCGRGTKTRRYSIITSAQDGGDECENKVNDEESKMCNEVACDIASDATAPPPPPPPVSGGSSTVIAPGAPGTIAPPPSGSNTVIRKDCEGKWGEWSDCTKTCGGGSMTRVYMVKVHAQGGGQLCEADDNEKQTQDCATAACNADACPCEKVSSSKEPLKECPDGKGMYGPGHCIQDEEWGCIQAQLKCSNAVDCKVSEWSEFGECSKTCGFGTYTRTRKIEVAPQFGGKRCPHLTEMRSCNTGSCRTRKNEVEDEVEAFPVQSTMEQQEEDSSFGSVLVVVVALAALSTGVAFFAMRRRRQASALTAEWTVSV